MNYSDRLMFIASAVLPEYPDRASDLLQISAGVRKLERALDEIVQQAEEEARLTETTANVVKLSRFRRIPIGGAS
jgi:hypothetical protein